MRPTVEEYDFKRFGEFGSYISNMPFVASDRGAGRLHQCPICGALRWSCWANARKHWEAHERVRGGDDERGMD